MEEKTDRTAPAQDLSTLVWRYYREYLSLIGDRLSDDDTAFTRGRHLELTPELRELADGLRRALGWEKDPPGGIELPQRFHDLLFSVAVGGGARLLRLLQASDVGRADLERRIGTGILSMTAAEDLRNWGDACIAEVEALAKHLTNGPQFRRFVTEILYVPGDRGFLWRIEGPADLLVRTFAKLDEDYTGREDALILEGCLSIDTDDPHGEVVRIAEEVQGIGLVMGIFETQPFDPRMLGRWTTVRVPGEGDEAGEVDLGGLSGAAHLAMGRLTMGEAKPESDLEAQLIRRGQGTELLERRKEQAAVILSAVDDRGLVLRRAGRLYLQAVAAGELGMTISSAFMCLEGLLLDRTVKDEVTGRLTEAVAYRIGKGATERKKLREQLKKLYELRSQYVHTGYVTGVKGLDGSPRELALEMARRALRREIEDWNG